MILALLSPHSAASPAKYGFINKSGKLVIPAKYDETTAFSEGLAAMKTEGGAGTGSQDKWAYLDSEGNTVIQQVWLPSE
ncbi:WG repeat-containing protein [Paenibacillus rhizovicinus]|uniref:WG repeat-containing protein n=1 Tax=Paenibacillus rhizovicinus TaxID=2704463 RepID=A0A6C0P8Z0_9BACL|nr:WG repeat-containing protein [Paenibacillus rhizovicinus]QHW35080.1 WG repeat-containing protein [Paenibacillus rhizovicinus]